jgi:drug/metabolite transporter (DMT)-like permease
MPDTLMTKEPSRALLIAAFAAIYIIWGSTYIAILIAIKDIPPLLMAGSRFMIAGILLFIFCKFKGETIPDKKSILNISFSGVLMLFFGTGAVAWVEQYIASGLAATIVATLPLWFVVLDKRQWKFHFSNAGIIIGLLVGFAGVFTLFADGKAFNLSGGGIKIICFFILIFGTISWAVGSLYSKYKPVEGSTGMKASVQMLAAGICFYAVSPFVDNYDHLIKSGVSTHAVAALLYLVLFGSLVGYMAYVWLLSVRSPALVGTYAYVNPIVAVFLGWLIAKEPITGQQMIALIVILSGVLLVAFSKEKKYK